MPWCVRGAGVYERSNPTNAANDAANVHESDHDEEGRYADVYVCSS